MKKNQKRIYLSPPHMSGREEKYVAETFTSNWIAPLGPQVDAFENELSAYLGVKEALVLSSGTAALHLALLLCGVNRDDLVISSTLTFAASVNPVLYLGAKPIFIDSEPESWNMSPVALKRAFEEMKRNNKLPKAVITVNLYGQSADIDPLLKLCNHFQVALIEDAAESLGATYKGKKSGSFGKLGILSFNGNKIITTSGGGALVSNDRDLIKHARYLATQARQPARHYEHTELGYNYRMSNVLAGIGRGQLEVLEERVKARRAIFERYFNAFSDIEGFDFMPEAEYGRSTRWLTVLTINQEVCGVSRDQIIDALEAENIEARPVWKPMHLQPLYSGCRYYPHFSSPPRSSPSWRSEGESQWAGENMKPFPPSPQPSPFKGEGVTEALESVREGYLKTSISDRLFEQGLCLPSGSNLTVEEQNRVITCIKKLL